LRPNFSVDTYEALSFLIIFASGIVASFFLQLLFWLFFLILLIDALATLARIDMLIAIDRIGLGIILLVSSLMLLNLNAIFLVLETLTVFFLIDFSLFVRKLAFTTVEDGLISRAMKSYSWTVGGSFGVSYIAIYLFSFLTLSSAITISALGFASAAVLAIIYVSVRSLKTPEA
jgi:hypothetical protein